MEPNSDQHLRLTWCLEKNEQPNWLRQAHHSTEGRCILKSEVTAKAVMLAKAPVNMAAVRIIESTDREHRLPIKGLFEWLRGTRLEGRRWC